MKWLPLKSLILTLPLVAFTATAANDGMPEAVLSACKDVLQNESAADAGRQCLESINGYLVGLDSAANDVQAQRPEQSVKRSGTLANLEKRAIETRAGGYMDRFSASGAQAQQPGIQNDTASSIEKRAIDTRAGGYMDRLNRMASEKACSLKQNERVTQIMSDLEVSAEHWPALVDSAKGILGREDVC
jgi:hypothetical protein